MVIFFLNDIHKRVPSGFNPKHSRFLYGIFLTVIIPPMFDIGDNLKECKGDLFPYQRNCGQRNNLYLEGGSTSKVVA
jgi:hypothetical protein